MSLNELSKFKLAKDLPPVIFLAGEESFLMDHYLQQIIDIGVPKDLRDFNVDLFYGPDVHARHVFEIARSFPMMTEKRVVAVKDIHKMAAADLEALAHYAKSPNPSTCLVLTACEITRRQKWVTSLQKHSFFLPCKPLYENQVVGWIIKELASKGSKIEPAAATLLAMQVGTRLRDLHNEIEKILLFVDDRKEITASDIAAIAGFRKEYTIFSLQNALGDRNLREALRILSTLRVNMPIQVIIIQLARFFNNLLIATGFRPDPKSDATLARITGISPYFVSNLHKFKTNYSVSELENALENIRQVDFSLKNFPVKEGLILEQLIIQIARGIPASRLPFASEI